MSSASTAAAINHLVIPGQVIASSATNSSGGGTSDENSFLRGHGTYVETVGDHDRLVASVCGTVQRVNKLITVIPYCESVYQGHVGDLVVGRVTSVGTNRWTVQLVTNQRDAHLPLSGVHLPGGAQRMRTAQDERDMRQFLQEGDLISAEVHKVQPSDGTLSLHTRSYRFTKLENGSVLQVPPALIPRRKHQIVSLINNRLDVLWGTNGRIWIQRKLPEQGGGGAGAGADSRDSLADLQEQVRRDHATTPVSPEDREAIARLRNAIDCLRLIHSMITPERAEDIYNLSLQRGLKPAQMLLPDNVVYLTETLRNQSQ